MRTKELGERLFAFSASASPIRAGRRTLRSKPPLAAIPACKNARGEGPSPRIGSGVASAVSIRRSRFMTYLPAWRTRAPELARGEASLAGRAVRVRLRAAAEDVAGVRLGARS